MVSLGRLLIFAGVALLALGALVLAFNKLNVPFGRLPGDFVWRGKNTTVYIPWGTCLLLSALGTLLFWLLSRKH